MLNVLKTQDFLKNLSDDQLAQLMRMPSPDTPQYLVLTELGRRKEMRDEARSGQAPQSTVAEEMVAQAQPQGIVGLPDETLAGAAMRARILGQKQMAGDVTVNPPGEAPQEPAAMARGGYVDYMADGGSAQYGNLFAPKAEPVQMAPQYPTSPATPAFTAPIPTVATPAAQAPIPQQVVPADRYGRHENPTSRQDIASLLADLNPEQRRRLERLRGLRLSGVGGVGVGGVGGAGVGGAGFAEGGIASLHPKRMSDGGPTEESILGGLEDRDLSMLAATQGDSLMAPWGLDRLPVTRAGVEREVERRRSQSPVRNWFERSLSRIGTGQVAGAQADEAAAKATVEGAGGIGRSIGSAFTQPENRPYGYDDPEVAAALGPRPGTGGGRGRMPRPVTPQFTPEVLTRPAVPAAVANVLAGKTAPKVAPKSAATSGSPTEGSIAPIEAPQAAPTAKDYGSDYMAQQRDLIERLTGSDAEDKERAKNLAIMKAGLAMMSSKDPNFLGAIGAGAQAGLGEYGEAARDIKKQQLARAAMEAEALGKAAVMSQQQDISNRQMAFDERQLAAQTALKERELASEAAYRSEQNAIQRENIQRYLDISKTSSEDAARKDLVDRIRVAADIMRDTDADQKDREAAARKYDALTKAFDSLYPMAGATTNVIGRDNLSQEMINSPWFQKQLAAYRASTPGQ